MAKFDKEQIRQFIKENDLKTAEDVQNALKGLFSDTLQEMLEAEMDHSLGYSKSDKSNKNTSNRRNGHSKKTVRSDYGEIDLEVPRDREGEFEPTIVKKHQKNITGIEDQILALYCFLQVLFPGFCKLSSQRPAREFTRNLSLMNS